MPTNRANADDVEDVSDLAAVGPHSDGPSPPTRQRNAFTELMKPKIVKHLEAADAPSRRTIFSGRDGLAAYTLDPAAFPQSRIVDYDDKFVVIQDLYPKASVHLLILPRDPKFNVLRPQEAFDDKEFLEECREKEQMVRRVAAEELRRKFGRYSKVEQERMQVLEADDLPDELPPGRDWMKDIKSGIHANPSMNHLHIHVLSRDMVSEPMRKTNHYLSFTTDFFVGLDQFPLAQDDHRRHYKHFRPDMLCWRCGRNFGNKISRLKEHLVEELEVWKSE